ncbi:MAG: hypothetical protein DRH21_06105 [Deltaproteobacteria bacterium]|nr:MAG: hypothetical protein DRH21_06105 [Deltaproteobacteria bacterium]
MHQPGSNPSTNDGPNTHPKDQAPEGHPEVRKYDELKYGQTYAPAQVPVTVTERLGRFFRTDDSSFWTGMLIGGVATFVLTSDTVKRAIVKSFAKVSEEAKEGVKKVKKAVAKEKEPAKAEKAEKK